MWYILEKIDEKFYFKILTFNNKSNEMSLRVAAMDYLALIASHLRRDAVESRGRDKDDLKEIIEQVPSNLLFPSNWFYK